MNKHDDQKKANESVNIHGFFTPMKQIVPEIDVEDDESAKPLGWYGDSLKARWHKHFTVGGDFDRRFSMFRSMGPTAAQALQISESQLFNLMAEAEMKGIDVARIVENSKRGLTESADETDQLAETITRLAKAYNIVERMEAISEERYPQLVSEATGDACMFITQKQMKDFEKLCDQLFAKFKIDFTFTKHFADRMSDERNTPCLTLKELAAFVKKMYADSGKKLKDNKDTEAVLKDLQSSINIPVAVNYDRNKDEFDVVMKTVMRKKNFHTPNKVVTYS